jgi:F420-dependent oxidoreductase-like protein
MSDVRLSIWPGTEHPWHEVLATARHAAETGWDGVWVADHFMPNTPDGSRPTTPRLEGWTALAALAATVERVRLGVLVSGNTYRHPAVVANLVATIDQVSGGRAVLGLGAGWQVNEHHAYGIELPPPRQRLERLEEACQVLRGLLREERTDLEGRHYRLVDAVCEPKPVAGGLGVPLLVGGAGERVTMRIAARHADEWNTWGLPDRIKAKFEVLERHCEDLGRDPAEIERSAQVFFHLTGDPATSEAALLANPGMPAAAGSSHELAEVVAGYVSIGLHELVVPDRTLGTTLSERFDTMDRLRQEVFLPAGGS